MIIAELFDHVFNDEEYYTHIRQTVRCFPINEEGKIGFLHVVGEDDFGVRDHLETIGGGVEINESTQQALHRELNEEIGADGIIQNDLGMVIDRYRHIHRITVSNYYVVMLNQVTTMQRTEAEQALIASIKWLTLEEALQYYSTPKTGVNKLIEDRDYQALLAYEKRMHD